MLGSAAVDALSKQLEPDGTADGHDFRERCDPLFLIIKGSMIPRSSAVFAEVERVRRTQDFREFDDLAKLDEIRGLLEQGRRVRVCGGSRWISVHAQLMELRRLGYEAEVHEPASYTLDYDGA